MGPDLTTYLIPTTQWNASSRQRSASS